MHKMSRSMSKIAPKVLSKLLTAMTKSDVVFLQFFRETNKRNNGRKIKKYFCFVFLLIFNTKAICRINIL